jgi:hypothetical protein
VVMVDGPKKKIGQVDRRGGGGRKEGVASRENRGSMYQGFGTFGCRWCGSTL